MNADVRLTKKELFRFLLYHMYFRPSGIIYAAVGLLSLGGGIYYVVSGNYSGFFLIAISAIYFILQPLLLYIKAGQQIKNQVFQDTTHYHFSDVSILVWQKIGEESELKWEDVFRFVKTKQAYYLYVDGAHANILPRASVEGDPARLDEMIRRNLKKQQLRGFGR